MFYLVPVVRALSPTFASVMTLENLKEMRERIQNLHRFLRIEDRLIKI